MKAKTMKWKGLLFPGGVALVVLLTGLAVLGQPLKAGAQGRGSTLTAVKVPTPPSLDGDA